MAAKKKEILYLHVSSPIKRWLVALAKKQVGRASQSTMAEQIFVAAKKSKVFKSG